MTTITAKEAKNRFGHALDSAQKGAVHIQKYGRSVAVLLSFEEYERLQNKEDAYWVQQANQAKRTGFVGKQKSQTILTNLLQS